MSLFDDDQFRWRDTYFVMFEADRRPSVDAVSKALKKLGARYLIHQIEGDDEGRFESVTVVAPHEYSALDVSFIEGEEVADEIRAMTDEIAPSISDPDERSRLAQARACSARFDVMHFEQVTDDGDPDEMVDPAALLAVLGVLTHLTGGVGIDPQSGELV